ncbi:CIA30 family protein [Robiginitomaculum antarcticum]|uniref:CIA30 family protein n=1 Tax=Robiginitomaculum antarcticum TaxID=437507 RepID=UPI0014613014|nr:CIA30 family protein [Robiginitomaculum antarcticum]
MDINLGDMAQAGQWRVVNDGVMGGKSRGELQSTDGFMRFAGGIVTDGGGFSSIRRAISPGALSGAESITMKIRSDGRQYQLNFRTDETFRGRSVAYRADIPPTAQDEWETVTVSLSGLSTSVFGQDVPAAPFDKTKVRMMGIILADGQDGAFGIDIARISVR